MNEIYLCHGENQFHFNYPGTQRHVAEVRATSTQIVLKLSENIEKKMSEDIPIELEAVEITNTQEDVNQSTKIEAKSMQLDNEEPQGNVYELILCC